MCLKKVVQGPHYTRTYTDFNQNLPVFSYFWHLGGGLSNPLLGKCPLVIHTFTIPCRLGIFLKAINGDPTILLYFYRIYPFYIISSTETWKSFFKFNDKNHKINKVVDRYVDKY